MKKKLTQNWCPPPSSMGDFYPKKVFHGWGGGTFFPKKLFIGGTFAGKD